MYEDFYHLKAKPFRLSPDPGFFFASRGHKRALAYLRYGLSQDEGFVVITGAPGTGKTTLAQILLKEMDQTHLVVAHLTTSQLEADELLRMISAAFGLRYDGVDKAGLLKTLEAFLLARSRERKRVLLVVDEAQNLPPRSLEELRMLSNLQVGDKALVQTFLLGQVQFRNKLDHPDLEQFRQRVIANYHLSELGEDECQSYIETRLRHVGWNGDPEFTQDAYSGIYQYTQGVPRRINMLCDRLMLFSCLEERHQVDGSVLRDVTDELRQEISGKPIKAAELTDAPVKNNETIPSGSTREKDNSLKLDKLVEDVRKEDYSAPILKNPDSGNPVKKQAGAGKNDAARSAALSSGQNSGLEKTLLNKVVAEESYDEAKAKWVTNAEEAKAVISNNGASNTASRSSTTQRGFSQPGSPQPASPQSTNDHLKVVSVGRADNSLEGAHTEKQNKIVTQSETLNIPLQNNSSHQNNSGDSEEVILRKILRLVLAYHRSPRSFPGLDDPSQPLPRGIEQILKLAVSDDEKLKNLRQISAMGITPAMLRAAVRFFVRRILFLPGGDDYRALGLSKDATLDQIEGHYGLLMRLMRQEKRSGEESSVARIGDAYERLCRGDITHIPEVKEEDDESIKEIDVDDGLDLDLSPTKLEKSQESIFQDPRLARHEDIVIESKRKGFNVRNLMLVVGAVVVISVLYITQQPNALNFGGGNEDIAKTDVPQDTDISQNNNKEDVSDSPATSVASSESNVTKEASSTEAATSGTTDDSSVEDKDAEQRRQRILAELRAKSEQEKAKQAEAAAEKARLEAELKKAQQAKAAAEAKIKQEAEARAKAEATAKQEAEARAKALAEARRVAQQKAAAEEKIRAENKAREVAAARAKAIAEAKAKAAKEKASKETKIAASNQIVAATSTSKAGEMRISDLNAQIAKLETTYAQGDLDGFSNLFSPNVRTNNYTQLAGLRKEYQTIFANTDVRRLKLENIDWNTDYDYARGTGEYVQKVSPRDRATITVKKGKVTLQVERNAGKLKIARLYLGDPTSEQELPANTASRATTGVLNEFLNNFVKAYEAGNIASFMGLFSAHARTDDRSNLAGIREDYEGLFSGTTSRKMTLSNMKWAWEEGLAKAVGSFVVEVEQKGNATAATYKGKLWMDVILVKGQPKISYFAFVTQ